MNLSFAESIPNGTFEEISNEMYDWENRFKSLVSEHKSIKFQFVKMPVIPEDVLNELERQDYVHIIVNSVAGQRFLVPGSK